jgi:hypothetical protein
MQVVFISYEKVAKEWRFYNPTSGCAIVSRDAIFDEQASWSWEKPSEDDGDITIEYHTLELGEPQGVQAHTAGTPMAHAPTLEPATSVHAATPVSVSPPPQPKFVSPQPNTEEYLNANTDDIGPRYRTVSNILGAGSPPVQAARQVVAAIHLQIEYEPGMFTEVEQHQPWCRPMLEDINSLKSNKTWRLVHLPPGYCPIKLKWVYKLKKNVTDTVIKHKARLIMNRYVQQQGVDFEEVFTPMAGIESVQLLHALAAQEKCPVHYMDIKSAFLNGELLEEVYVQ